MNKINRVIKFEDLPSDALEALEVKYPSGWKDFVRKITKPNGDYFHAINVDTHTVSYLVKVNVKVDSKSDLERIERKLENAEMEDTDEKKIKHVSLDEVEIADTSQSY